MLQLAGRMEGGREGGSHCRSRISVGCIIVHAIVIVVVIIGIVVVVSFVRIRTTFMYKFPIRGGRTSYGEAGGRGPSLPLRPCPLEMQT